MSEPSPAAGSRRGAWWLLLGVVVVAAGWWWWSRQQEAPLVEVTLPRQLSPLAQRGKAVFEAQCASCHGATAGGSDRGPPLVHPIYRPAHHADFAFATAIRLGVRQHHWFFGDMPPQPEVADDDIPAVIAYLRELQRANGVR